MDVEDIKRDFSRVYFEDPLIATKFIFYAGDVRGGLGERKVFNSCMNWLVENKPEVALCILDFIPEYTRWDNLAKLVDSKNKMVSSESMRMIKNQIAADIVNMNEGKSISLCAKWLPSINASSVKK